MGSSDITNVYAALDRTHTIVALERSRRGDEGFRTFFDEFADYAANKGYIPYLLLLNFHVDDSSRLPPIEAKERGYRLAHLAPLEVKDIRQALTLYDLLYCRKHGLDPLAAQNTARNLCYKDDYAGFRNESIPALSQPGAPYRAVETEGGVALFRRGERGDEAARSFFAFLTAHPDGRGRHLRGRNFAHIRCGTLRGAILLGGVPAVFRPRADALRAAPQRTVRQRAATGLLPQRVRHAGRGREARGRSGLRNRGIVRGVAAPADDRNAPAYRTQRLRTFLLGRLRLSGIRLPVRGSVQERRSETCSGHDGRRPYDGGDILRTCFGIDPAREEPPCPLPSGDIRFYRDFLSIDLLFRPERLLERYERDRDRREMPCHILKH